MARSLLLVVEHDIVNVVSICVLALEGRGARFSIFGDLRDYGYYHLAALLQGCLYGVGINALHRDHVGVGEAGNRVVLAVEFCFVLNVKRTSVGVSPFGTDFDALIVSFDLSAGTPPPSPRTLLPPLSVHL